MEGKKITSGTCCGCTACKNICPRNAIVFEENQKGFLEPQVELHLCIDCKLCSTTCNMTINKHKVLKTFLIKQKDSYQHLASQSGGAFVAISDVVLSHDGSVFGVVMDEKLEAKYGKAESVKERELMRGSKYMQARVEDAYREVENALKTQKVLFSGTPCCVGGLIKYLTAKKVDMSNLYTVDLICHGTPSVKIWRAVLESVSCEAGEIKYAICRDKAQTGWGGSKSTFYGNRKISSDLFCRIYFTDLCLRDSCYTCQYTTKDRIGDITIGDAWGVQEKNPEFYDPMGVSLMCINTEKGEWLFDSFNQNIEFKKVNLESYAQKNMSEPSYPHRSIEQFWDDFDTKSFSFIQKKYGENNILLNFRYAVKKGVNLLCKKR